MNNLESLLKFQQAKDEFFKNWFTKIVSFKETVWNYENFNILWYIKPISSLWIKSNWQDYFIDATVWPKEKDFLLKKWFDPKHLFIQDWSLEKFKEFKFWISKELKDKDYSKFWFNLKIIAEVIDQSIFQQNSLSVNLPDPNTYYLVNTENSSYKFYIIKFDRIKYIITTCYWRIWNKNPVKDVKQFNNLWWREKEFDKKMREKEWKGYKEITKNLAKIESYDLLQYSLN